MSEKEKRSKLKAQNQYDTIVCIKCFLMGDNTSTFARKLSKWNNRAHWNIDAWNLYSRAIGMGLIKLTTKTWTNSRTRNQRLIRGLNSIIKNKKLSYYYN